MLHYYKLIIYVLEFHAEHIGQHIGISEMAAMVALSKSHFLRVFKSIMGESPGRYIYRQNMEYAKRLMRSNPSITILALSEKLGYSTPENFTTAFKKFYGISPCTYKNEVINSMQSLPNKRIEQNFRFEGISVLPDRHVIFKKITTGYQADIIFLEFKRITEFAKSIDIPVNQLFGMRIDDPRDAPADQCKYDVCVVIDSPEIQITDSHYKVKTLKTGYYAVLLYEGEKEGLHEVRNYLVNHWISKNGYTLIVSPWIETFVLADQDKTGKFKAKLLLPVKNENEEQYKLTMDNGQWTMDNGQVDNGICCYSII
jgi:AraC-like DNA-binding protein/DNA gyrase inhibitor GyrI